ncbi:hypothetical protein K227x_10600 [Rubripirellula lacrimiformis]|uniref:Methyltransferase type 11 domain-containing protein n=1 Tax=Rubripirellula lacrimiformis TaxID=1930273 RepID=A0A517N6C6_9BACT|nr:class I SAM-dependent methyltransferase [Rubripirellula lacrimiformis]QDT02682.1 hypothetical protein K227x_10600 [Rubripirellula lacrimiformis]
MNGPIAWYHGKYVHRRRVDVLRRHFCELIPDGARVLDIGCGDGWLSSEIVKARPDVSICGMDVLVRPDTLIDVTEFDGATIPLPTNSVDVAILVDVLHHTHDPARVLVEAARVARDRVVIKDHFLRGIAAQQTLAFMDQIGNSRHGVEIPCNYLTPDDWTALYDQAQLEITESRQKLGLYPPPLSWLFERGLHFVASLNTKPSGPPTVKSTAKSDR